MGLDASTYSYIDKLLHVVPIYGWGWEGNTEEPYPPPEFNIRLRRLWTFMDEVRGGVATVEQPGHSCDGNWIVFSTRQEGTYDFVEKICSYNILVYTRDPHAKDEKWPKAVEPLGGSSGFADISAVDR